MARLMLCGSAAAAVMPLKTRRKSRRSVVVILILASPLFGRSGDARSAQLRSCDGFVIDRRRNKYSDRAIEKPIAFGLAVLAAMKTRVTQRRTKLQRPMSICLDANPKKFASPHQRGPSHFAIAVSLWLPSATEHVRHH